MKKILLFTSSILFIGSLFAQAPTILGTYLPVVNTEIKQVWNVNPNQGGANIMEYPTYSSDNNDMPQVWDYSNSFPTNAGIDTFSLVSYAPNNPLITNLQGQSISQYFPLATHASFIESPFPDADSLWSFYRIDTSGFYNLGHFALKAPNIQGLVFDDTTLIMTNEELVVPFKVNYGDQFLDTSVQLTYFMYDAPFLGVVPAQYIKTTTFEYDVNGFGTLITPAGTFNDVLLATGTVEKHDSVRIDTNNDGTYDTHVPNSSIPGLSDYSASKRHFFLANATFATSLLMQLNTNNDPAAQLDDVSYGWYTLPSKFGSIEGTVYADTVAGHQQHKVANGEVYLFREHGNFVKDDILATVKTNANGVYLFDSIPYGQYRIAARMMDPIIIPSAPNDIEYTPEHSYLSYFEDTASTNTTNNPALGVDWTQCDVITTTGPTTFGKDIYIRHDTLANAQSIAVPSLLTGTLTGINLNKQGGDDPIPGIDVILKRDPSSQPVISTQTNEFGNFSFTNLPDGDYKIWVDMPGVDVTSSYNFNVNKGIYTRCEFDFTSDLDSIQRTGQNANTCLTFVNENIKEINSFSIYPNPYESSTVIELELEELSEVSVTVFDVTGKLIQTIVNSKALVGTQSFDFNPIKDAGIYLVKVKIGEQESTKRLIKL